MASIRSIFNTLINQFPTMAPPEAKQNAQIKPSNPEQALTVSEKLDTYINRFTLDKLIKFADTCKNYIDKYGKTAPSQYTLINYLLSYTAFPTNQSFNEKLFNIVEEAKKNKEMHHEAVCVCGALQKLNEIHKEMINDKRAGTTTAEIEKIMAVYQLPIDNEECKRALEKIGDIVKNARTHSLTKKEG